MIKTEVAFKTLGREFLVNAENAMFKVDGEDPTIIIPEADEGVVGFSVDEFLNGMVEAISNNSRALSEYSRSMITREEFLIKSARSMAIATLLLVAVGYGSEGVTTETLMASFYDHKERTEGDS